MSGSPSFTFGLFALVLSYSVYIGLPRRYEDNRRFAWLGRSVLLMSCSSVPWLTVSKAAFRSSATSRLRWHGLGLFDHFWSYGSYNLVPCWWIYSVETHVGGFGILCEFRELGAGVSQLVLPQVKLEPLACSSLTAQDPYLVLVLEPPFQLSKFGEWWHCWKRRWS